jgi:hypothetical protein
MDAVPGVRVAEEPKPYEPRGHILYGTTPEGILLGMKVEGLLKNPENRKLLDEGHTMCCMNPEVGHMLMAFEDMPYAFSLVLEYGRLAHTHWNAQPLGNYDQDLNVGMISPEAAEAALYMMKMHGYQASTSIPSACRSTMRSRSAWTRYEQPTTASTNWITRPSCTRPITLGKLKAGWRAIWCAQERPTLIACRRCHLSSELANRPSLSKNRPDGSGCGFWKRR